MAETMITEGVAKVSMLTRVRSSSIAQRVVRAHRGTLTPADHAAIRQQLALIPVYIWCIYGWFHLVARVPLPEPVHDFAHFYVQGTIALERNARALYDIDAMARVLSRVVPSTHEARFPPVYGPQVSMMFSPIALIPYRAAMYVWLAISLLVYGYCGYAIWRACPHLRDQGYTVAALLIAAPALYFLVGFVQISAVGLACVTAGYFCLRAGRTFWAGAAFGMLGYKPPLGLAVAAVWLLAREWRLVLGAIAAVAAQIVAAITYWKPSILVEYIGALRRIPSVAEGMEPFKYHMHSWRAFFDLLGLTGHLSLVLYAVAAIATTVVALVAWQSRGPLTLRYAVLLIATVLVDPHLYAYDLILLTPALMLLWDWTLAEHDQRDASRIRWLVFICYLSPLFGFIVPTVHVQVSVLAFSLLAVVLTTVAVASGQVTRIQGAA